MTQHDLEHIIEPFGPQLWHRFQGRYRAVIVDTNDPLCMHRVRFRVPEMHDGDLAPELCMWANVATSLGGKRAREWRSPCIGDQIWIDFEKDHPYGPVMVGFADPLRRKNYAYPSVYCKTPLPVDDKGAPAKQPEDFTEEYLPKDGRPMSQGTQDRYGNLDMMSSVGFFPVEHKDAPPSPGYDPVQQADFQQSKDPPKANDPDCKFMIRMTKYGHMMLMGDQGYTWLKKDQDGEFMGDVLKDEGFETKRWTYLQRLINEDKPSGYDQRRFEVRTRYGHKLEMRDVGYAQKGPQASKSRDGEYDKPTTLSSESERDERWIKLRTKGGHVFQMCDMGFDPAEDEFVKRKLVEEIGNKADGEDDWKGKDARQMRFVTRHGFKFVLDDRGSDTKNADTKESPHGNGILIKGRRSGGSQGKPATEEDPKGFFWEFNEHDDTNQTTWGSPLGNVIQINDKHQYIMLTSRSPDYPNKWQGLKENEFLLEAVAAKQFENNSHHVKIDHHNEYLRIKTRCGQGASPDGKPVNEPSVGPLFGTLVNQGMEARDGMQGDGAWVEVVDAGERNFWMWNKGKMIMCHARRQPDPVNLMWWMDENKRELVIRHAEDTGRIQIICNKDIEILSKGSTAIHAEGTLWLKGEERIILTGGSTDVEISDDAVKSTVKVKAPEFPTESPSVDKPDPPEPADVPQLSPTDRGVRYNSDLDKPAQLDEIQPKL